MLAKYDKPDACRDCALYELGKGFAPASGPSRARLSFIGESLGYNEAIQGFPFVGAAGGMFERVLNRAEIKRDYSRVHNCVNCSPPGDWLDGAPWQASALTHCRTYLQQTLDEVPDNGVVVTLGGVALKQVLDLWGLKGITVNNFHGTVHRDPTDRFFVVPTYHPSFLQRGAINLFDVVRFDLDLAKRVSQSGAYPRRPTRLLLDPPVERFRQWITTFKAAWTQNQDAFWLSVDIETPDKARGRDEGDLTDDDTSTIITRINFACDPDEGLTVPYVGPYIQLIEELLSIPCIKLLWHKAYDEPRIQLAGHSITGEFWDLMWCAHHLHSDYPLGLGFWAPFASDYGAWKHLSEIDGRDVEYAGVDGFQTLRVGHWLVGETVKAGLWPAFYRHSHLREQYVLRPAHDVGIGVDIAALDAFHAQLQTVAAEKLTLIDKCAIAGTVRPKEGYADKPKGEPCPDCEGIGFFSATAATQDQDRPGCARCDATGFLDPVPPKSILGKAGEKGDTAKQDYIEKGIHLVQKDILREIRVCDSCGKRSGIGPKHNCVSPRRGKGHAVPDGTLADPPPTPAIRTETVRERRWFWQLPFNPESPKQILQYIKDTGNKPGKAKKTRKDTTDKETLRKLYKKTGDPVYQYLLDYKAVKKVDSTYAVGAKKRIWADGRLHPTATQRPSTHRDSYVNPNIQNVIADKEGKLSLAAGFRKCIVSAVTINQLPVFAQQEILQTAPPGAPAVFTGCRLVEIDFSGIEAVETGWFIGDPQYIRLATLGVHAYLTSHLLAEEGKIAAPASLSWSDEDLSAFFADIKKRFALPYDKAKRCVHGNNYGLTIFGMVQNFPDVYLSLKDAQRVQDLYYMVAPGLPALHKRLRDHAYEHHYLGGPYIDDYTLLSQSCKHHPFSYRHDFHGVMSFRPLSEKEYHTKVYWNKKRGKHPLHGIRLINNRPFDEIGGPDVNRVIAMFPQGTSSGVLKEVELRLFHPDSPSYIGTTFYGRTPLRAPIHDSLLLEIPNRLHDYVVSLAVEEFRKPIVQQPCPDEWGIGPYLRVNIAAKTGVNWEDMEDLPLPKMAPPAAREQMYLPSEEDQYEDILDLETRIM